MGFTIKCGQCGIEIELHQTDVVSRIGRTDEKIFSHSNGIACACGNKVYNNLTKEFFFLQNQCDPVTQEHMGRLQNFTFHLDGVEAVWAQGCLSKAFGIVDSSITILELIPVTNETLPEGFDPLAAMLKCAYSYHNMLSLFHDLLDNIGFMYGVRVMKKNVEDYAMSFFKIFKSGEPTSTNESLNKNLNELYKKSKEYAEQDNNYKHRFSPGLIQLRQPEEFIRNLGKAAGNIVDFLDHGAVPTDKTYEDAKTIKDEILQLALTCAIQLIYYEKEGLL